MRNPVRIRKRKFDRRITWDWDGDLVEEGGDWLVVYHGVGRHVLKPPGAVGRTPAPYALSYLSTRLPVYITVYFNEHGAVVRYQCDAGLPATVSNKGIEFVDLDLDLVVSPLLTYRLHDEETLVENIDAMGYSREAVATAREGIRQATALIEQHKEPFDGSAPRLLGRVLASSRLL